MKHISPKHRQQAGVTLVELAIGIVIIALLIVSVLAGRNLVRGAKIRAVVSEIEQFNGSITRFQDEFLELPGDITDATQRWSGTADGNGDEQMTWASGEGSLAWRHLQLADMLSADTIVPSTTAVVNVSVPASKYPGGGWFIDHNATMGNHIGLGAADGAGMNDDAILTPKDARSIDFKMDDGKANSGRVQGDDGSSTSDCRQDADASLYDFEQDSPQCYLRMSLDVER
jgi:type II secretory pathway pseudopilin PulG